MKKCFLIALFPALLLSCKEEQKSDTPKLPDQSEMSALMLKMYEENEKVRQQIINGDELSKFSEEFLNIHTAKLTDPGDRTSEFKAYSDIFLSNQKIIFEIDKDSVKDQFNQTINSCIACHQTACPGPIPRIKKLYIK